jgi:hypothetical protein
MNKFFVFILVVVVALVTSGCVTIQYPDGSEQKFAMLQVGIVARVVNNCAPFLDLERVNGLVVEGLPYGGSVTIPLVSTPFTGSNRRMPLVAKGYNENREYLGSSTHMFSVNTSQGSQEEVWTVDRLDLPTRRGMGCR